MVDEIEFTNFKVEPHLADYVDHNYGALKKKATMVETFKLKYTKVDNQGYVVNISGSCNGDIISSWWTGFSLRHCTDKIFEDFLSKYYQKIQMANINKSSFKNYKSYPMDSFGFSENS